MKKKLITLGFMILITLCMTGCGKKAKSEYTTAEFVPLWKEIVTDARKDVEYVTDEEYSKEYQAALIKHAKKKGFQEGQEITLLGCLQMSFTSIHGYSLSLVENESFNQSHEDGEIIGCSMKDANNQGIFIDPGSVVKVKGKILQSSDFPLSDCEVISPDLDKMTVFEPNIADLSVDIVQDKLVMGSVEKIVDIAGTKEERQQKSDNETNTALSMFYLQLVYGTHIVTLTDGYNSIYCIVNQDLSDQKLQVGDNIAIRDTVNDCDGTLYMGNTFTFYIFK